MTKGPSKHCFCKLLAGLLAGSLWLIGTAMAQSNAVPVAHQSSFNKTNSSTPRPSPSSPRNWHTRQATYFKLNWGVDVLGVHLVSSGHMLEFRYRVLDANKAKPINDKRFEPFLVDEKTGRKLTVPVMEKVGALRQTETPKEGRVYWMFFGNEGKLVKPGDLVDVYVGNFKIKGVEVE
jgi:hypothetical protein